MCSCEYVYECLTHVQESPYVHAAYPLLQIPVVSISLTNGAVLQSFMANNWDPSYFVSVYSDVYSTRHDRLTTTDENTTAELAFS